MNYNKNNSTDNQLNDDTDSSTEDGNLSMQMWIQQLFFSKDSPNLLLLTFLYVVQGIPMGLVFGALPFLLKQNLAYWQIGVFALSGYPYSLKLLWSPIVDSCFFASFGRRKTWIVPMQFISGFTMIWLSYSIDQWMSDGDLNIYSFTFVFTLLVFCCATQDVAVDSLAIALLPVHKRALCSTVQTLGLQIGFFSSSSIFLALNSVDFCNNYLRWHAASEPLLSLSHYFWFWGWLFVLFTVYLCVAFKEPAPPAAPLGALAVYRQALQVIQLKPVQRLAFVLLFVKLGLIVFDAATLLILLDKGFGTSNVALFAIIDFPLQILIALFAARYSSGDRPLSPYRVAFVARIVAGVGGAVLVYFYPVGPPSFFWFALMLLGSLLYSFGSNVMFVAQGAFFARITDDSIAGTYLTLLNTISNLGGTLWKPFVLAAIDTFSTQCDGCQKSNGYYTVAALSLIYSVIFLFVGIDNILLPLQLLPRERFVTHSSSNDNV